jgi:octaprenyl-diphosphate synthase
VDDILDFAGDPAVFGKALGQDVVEGTVTLPLTYALELEPSLQSDVRVLIETFHRDRGGDQRDDIRNEEVPDASDIVERVRNSGALERSRETAAQLTSEAIEALQSVPESPYRRGLTLLGASLLDRVS